jgi:uncharacterized membrane protein
VSAGDLHTGGTDAGPLRRWVSSTLSVGVWTSVTVVALGVAWGLVTGRTLDLDRTTLLADLTAGQPGSVVLLGLLLLLLTPVAQLVAAAAAFGRNRERGHMAIAMVVLVILMGSLVLAATTQAGG